jgi:hypothetical protein
MNMAFRSHRVVRIYDERDIRESVDYHVMTHSIRIQL